jgi:hypothetical protein
MPRGAKRSLVTALSTPGRRAVDINRLVLQVIRRANSNKNDPLIYSNLSGIILGDCGSP